MTAGTVRNTADPISAGSPPRMQEPYKPVAVILDDFSADVLRQFKAAARLTLADIERIGAGTVGGAISIGSPAYPASENASGQSSAGSPVAHGDWTLHALLTSLHNPDSVDLILIDLDAPSSASLAHALSLVLGNTRAFEPAIAGLLQMTGLAGAMTPAVVLAPFAGASVSADIEPGVSWLAAHAGAIVQAAPNVGQPAFNWASTLTEVVSVGAWNVDALGATLGAAPGAVDTVDVFADGSVHRDGWGEAFGTSFAAARVAAALLDAAVEGVPLDLDSRDSEPILLAGSAASPSAAGDSVFAASANSYESAPEAVAFASAPASTPLSGTVTHWASGAAMPGVRISLFPADRSLATKIAVSPASGSWSLADVTVRSDYLIEAARADTSLMGAITSADALAALALALGRNPNPDPDGAGPLAADPVSPYQRIAADIDGDGRVSLADAQAIARLAALGESAPQPGWRFIDSAAVPPGASAETAASAPRLASLDAGARTTADFVGVLLGDVDGSWRQPTLSGTVTEAGNLDSGSATAGTPSTSGLFAGAQPSGSTTRSWSVQAPVSSTYGNLSVNSSTGTWTYTLNNAATATQLLNEGQSVTQTYTVRVTETSGAYTDETITVTVNGANDAPVITNSAAARTGNVTEAGNLANGTPTAGTPSASGTLTASDVDANATRTWSLQGAASTTYGGMTINSSTGVWTYTLNNSAAATQSLSEGESVSQSYTVRVTDNFGAYTDQQVVVIIAGTDDLGIVVEAGNAANGAAIAGDSSASGMGSLDPSLGATPTWSVQSSPATTYGSMGINSSTGEWTYALGNSLSTTQMLDAGDVVVQSFTLRTTDSTGRYADQQALVTINGTNDAPVLTLGSANPSAIVETGIAGAPTNKSSSVSILRQDVDDLTNFVVGDWIPSAPTNISGIDFDTYTRRGNFGQATLFVNQPGGSSNDSVSFINYTLDDNLTETQSLSAGVAEVDRFYLSVTDGDVVTTRRAQFGVTGADDAMTWSPGASAPVVIHRVGSNRAVVRIDPGALAIDPDSSVSYLATLARDGVSVANTSISLVASGGSLVGLITTSAANGTNYTLNITASGEAGNTVAQSFSGVTIADAYAVPVPGPSGQEIVFAPASTASRITASALPRGVESITASSFIGSSGNDTFEGMTGGYAMSGGEGIDSAVFNASKAKFLRSGTTFSIWMMSEYQVQQLGGLIANAPGISLSPEFAQAITQTKYSAYQAAALLVETSDGRAYLDVENIVFSQSTSATTTIDRAFSLGDDVNGNLLLSLSSLDDRVLLGGLADNVAAGAGNDVLIGGGNGNGFIGPNGELLADDILRGGDGDDVLAGGGRGNGGVSKDISQLFGDTGDDVLVAVSGKVTATGGTGRDVFAIAFDSEEVHLFIKDFNASVDAIDLTGLVALKAAVQGDSAATQDRAQALLDIIANASQTAQGLELNLDGWLDATARSAQYKARIVIEPSANSDGQLGTQNFVFAAQPYSPAGWRDDLIALV